MEIVYYVMRNDFFLKHTNYKNKYIFYKKLFKTILCKDM